MPPATSVPHLDVVEQGAARVFSCGPVRVHRQFSFQRRKEALRDRVVPTIPTPAHARGDGGGAEQGPVVLAGVLHAAIGVMDHPGHWVPVAERHQQRIAGQFPFERVSHRPTHHASRAQVEDNGQVDQAFARRDVGNIGRPDVIRAWDTRHRKLSVQHVRRDGIRMRRIGGHAKRSRSLRTQAIRVHQLRDPIHAAGMAQRFEFRLHARAP